MLRVVADSNVLVSAVLNVDGPPSQVVRAAFQQRLTLIVSAQLLDELANALARPKIARIVPPERSQLFVDAVEGVGVAVGDPAETPAIVRDRRDDYLVALAVAAHADRLVKGDADLLELMDTGVIICTPPATRRTVARSRQPQRRQLPPQRPRPLEGAQRRPTVTNPTAGASTFTRRHGVKISRR